MFQSIRRAFLLVATLAIALGAKQALAIAYTWNVVGPANWDGAGNWTPSGPPAAGDTGAISSGTATANAILTGLPDITVSGTGKLIYPTFAGAAPIAGSITAQSGGRIDWTGAGATPHNDLTPVFFNGGSSFIRSSSDTQFDINSPITFNAGTTTAAGIAGSVDWSPYALSLRGTINGSGNLLVSPTSASDKNAVRIWSSSANPFAGTATVAGTASVHGTLVLQGTGALANTTGVTINPFGVLRLNTGSDLLPGGFGIAVGSGARVEWGGHTTYSATPPTLTFSTGSTLGRGDSDVQSSSHEAIVIPSGQVAVATRILGSVDWTPYTLTLLGPLSGSGQLQVSPATANEGGLRINPSVANTFNGTIDISGIASSQGTLVLEGTGALQNINPGAITINPFGQLRLNTGTDLLPSAYALTVNSGARVEWGGKPTYSGTAPTITFNNGSTMGRGDSDLFNNSTSLESIVINGTVKATRIRGTVNWQEYSLRLSGPLSGAGTLRIEPSAIGGELGALDISPTTANGFTGNVEVAGNTTNYGTLILSGTGALAGISSSSLQVQNHGVLRLANATNPLPSGFFVDVQTGGRVEWLGTSTYSVTKPTFVFQNGTTIGRDKNDEQPDVAVETISLAPGATLTTDFPGTVLQELYSVKLTGALIGNNTTTLHVQPAAGASKLGVTQINTTSANSGFSGKVLVDGLSAAARGVLLVKGTGPLGAATVDVGAFGVLSVGTNGALDNVASARVQSNGSLRFRVTGGSTLSNTTLTGTGLVRSERTLAATEEQGNNYSLESLTLNNVTVSPGNSPGVLSFDATSVLFGTGSKLSVEVGSLADMIDVNGILNLSSGSSLVINPGSGMATGNYIVATYDNLVGTFGSITSNLSAPFIVTGVDYGTINPNAITVLVFQVPEPSTCWMLVTGVAAIGAQIRRRRRG